MTIENKNYIWIDSVEILKQNIAEINHSEYLSIDLEADNQHLYEEQVCLVQISNGSNNYLIDTLAFKDLSELHAVCRNPKIPKIFHDLEFDLKSMNKEFKCNFSNLFDTKMAAEFCGEEKCGLSALLEKHLKLTLAKEYQQANWTLRPISEKMIQYSINDSYHLNELKSILTNQLKELNRLHWFEEECILKESFRYSEPQHPEFVRIKLSLKLKEKQLNLLKHICELRDQIAKENNISRFQILSNKVAIEICMGYPNSINMNYLHKIIKPEFHQSFFNKLLDAYRIVTNEEPITHPLKEEKAPAFLNANIDKIKKWRLALSEKLKMPAVYLWPTDAIDIIANNPEILNQGLANIPHLRQWQIQEFGDEFLKKVKGKLKQPQK